MAAWRLGANRCGELLLQRKQQLSIGLEEALSELRALARKSHSLIRIANRPVSLWAALAMPSRRFGNSSRRCISMSGSAPRPISVPTSRMAQRILLSPIASRHRPILPFSLLPDNRSWPRCAAIIPWRAGPLSHWMICAANNGRFLTRTGRSDFCCRRRWRQRELASTRSSLPIRWRCCAPIVSLREQPRLPVPLIWSATMTPILLWFQSTIPFWRPVRCTF